jgi:sulfoxide reductase catalytic subunit YedY
VAEEDGPGGPPGAGYNAMGTEKHIGRRAFLTLLGAGVVALVFGRDLLSLLFNAPEAGSFAINTVSAPPPFEAKTWRLTVVGLVQKPLEFSWDDFLSLPQTKETRDFECVEGWGVKGVEWTGVRMRELMDRAKIDPTATHLVFHSGELEYTDSLTVAEAQADEILLAHELNGKALSVDHGRPVRLIVPGRYGYKYVKWVMKIDVIAAGPEGYQGYWENRGYTADAKI